VFVAGTDWHGAATVLLMPPRIADLDELATLAQPPPITDRNPVAMLL
jgi:hypothetical protein